MKRGVDYIGVGIGAVIIDPKGKIFLSKRGPKSQNEIGKWSMPGGTLEFGESFEQAIIREMQEEFGITVEIRDTLEPFNHLIPEEHQHWVALCFICKLKYGTPEIKEPDKSEQIGWFNQSELKRMDLTHPAQHRLRQLNVKYPGGIPNFYI
jgi:8-oxo-dGTP diphosphatase